MRQKDTISKKLNFLWAMFFIPLFLYSIYLTFTHDQQSYLKYHKSVAEQEALPAVVRDFTTFTSSSRYYSRIGVNGNPGKADMVVRSVSDYIGKEIKVKRLSNGTYIRDSYVFSVSARNRLIYMVIAVILVSLKFIVIRKRK